MQIKQFIHFLSVNEQVRIVIRYGGYSRLRSYSWLKMKLWELSINTHTNEEEYRIGYVNDEHLIRLVEEICEHSLKSHSLKHSVKQYNMETLDTLTRI